MYKATSTRKVQRTEKEIERDLAIVERELESERKLLEASQSELNRIYETSGPTPWTKDLQSKVDEHVKNVARLEGQEESLRAEIPPRPLPQPESVRGSGSLKGRLTSSQNAQAQPGPPPSQSSPIKKSNNVTPKKTPVTSSQYAVVMWGYDARQSDEISLKSNDKVLVLQLYGYKPEDTEWYLVKNTSNGTSGYYPTCYLQLVNELGQLKPPVLFKASVLFDYNSMNEDELDLRIGDVIDVINQDDPGWWTGEIDGKLGLFPANFVQKINSSNSDSKSKNKTLPFVAVSLYGYNGNSADELSFSKGEKLKIIGQEMNGWYKGFLVKAPNKIGLIPGNYIDKQMLEPPIKGNQNTDFKAEFWKNLEKEGRFPIAGAAGTLVGGPPGSEEEPLLEKPKKNEKKGGCCIIV